MKPTKKTLQTFMLAATLGYFGLQSGQSQSDNLQKEGFIGSVAQPPSSEYEKSFIDYDVDGDLDILTTFKDGEYTRIAVYENESQNNYAKISKNHFAKLKYIGSIKHPCEGKYTLSFADTDSDGDLDILTTFKDGKYKRIAVYENESQNNYAKISKNYFTKLKYIGSLKEVEGADSQLTFSDVDRDGDLDVIRTYIDPETDRIQSELFYNTNSRKVTRKNDALKNIIINYVIKN